MGNSFIVPKKMPPREHCRSSASFQLPQGRSPSTTINSSALSKALIPARLEADRVRPSDGRRWSGEHLLAV